MLVTRLKIFDSLRARKINPSSEFIQDAIEFVLEEYGLVMDQLTDNSMASLYKNVEVLRKDLRRRVKNGKYDEFRKNYLFSYLQIPFTFDLEIRDDLGDFAENNSVWGDNDKQENDHMTNDNTKNGDDFEEYDEANGETNGKTNEYEEQIKDGSNFELSEQFISFIIQQVNVLCEHIKSGDPDIERTREVNQKLNDAVDCYRIKLDPEKQIFAGSGEYLDDIGDFLLGIKISIRVYSARVCIVNSLGVRCYDAGSTGCKGHALRS